MPPPPIFPPPHIHPPYSPPQTSEKTYKLCGHGTCTVAGLTADANILIDQARLRAGRYRYQYQEDIPLEQLVEHVCNYKQAYTQYGGLRPFGVAFLFAGYDPIHGFQLYQSDPSGNYSGWKATVIGANNQAGKSLLKTEYGTRKAGAGAGGGEGGGSAEEKEEEEEKGGDGEEMKTDEGGGTTDGAGPALVLPDVAEALRLAVRVLSKTMDGTVPSPDKMELFTMTRPGEGDAVLEEGAGCVHHILTEEESKRVVDEVEAEGAAAGDS